MPTPRLGAGLDRRDGDAGIPAARLEHDVRRADAGQLDHLVHDLRRRRHIQHAERSPGPSTVRSIATRSPARTDTVLARVIVVYVFGSHLAATEYLWTTPGWSGGVDLAHETRSSNRAPFDDQLGLDLRHGDNQRCGGACRGLWPDSRPPMRPRAPRERQNTDRSSRPATCRAASSRVVLRSWRQFHRKTAQMTTHPRKTKLELPRPA